MDDEPPSPNAPDLDRSDAAADGRRLETHAAAARDATWDDQDVGRHVVPGIVSGDLGPKGRVSAQLRDLSRHERSMYGKVMRGTTHGDGMRYLLLPALGLALGLCVLAALIMWLAT